MHFLLLLLLMVAAPALAIEPPEFWPSPPLPVAEARPLTVSSSVERELMQVDALVTAAAWDEAVDAMVRLVSESGHELVPMHDSSQPDNYYLPLAQACHARMAKWPAEALAVYRGRVDPTAESLLKAGRTNRDRDVLRRVVDNYFTSSPGDEALLALSDLVLEAGKYSQARGYLLQLSPAVAEAYAGGVYASRRMPLVYPDSDLPAAELLARLAMISIREGSFAQAEAEVATLKQQFPDAVGIIGGREANLAQLVSDTLSAARNWPTAKAKTEWPTTGGSVARARVTASLGDLTRVAWQHRLSTPPVHLARPRWDEFVLGGGGVIQRRQLPAAPTVVEPLTSGGAVVVSDAGNWTALDAATGKPLFGESGQVYQANGADEDHSGNSSQQAASDRKRRPVIIGGRRAQVRLEMNQIQIENGAIVFGGNNQILLNDLSPRVANDLSSSIPLAMLEGNLLYAVVTDNSDPAPVERRRPPRSRLMAFDLGAEGKLRMEIAPKQQERISGPPVVVGPHLYLPLHDDEGGGRLSITCYLRATGRQLWQTPVASVTPGGQDLPPDVLVAGNGMLFLNTSAGMIIAVRADDGQVAWVRSYQRASSIEPNDLASVPGRYQGACALAGGALVCAPADAAALFALEPMTGRVLWVNMQAFDVTDILGVAGERLIVSGRQLWMIDPITGRTQFAWPASPAAGIVGSGRGCIAGDEIFWPTERAIYAVSATTGQPTRSARPLARLGETGAANLVPCGNGLLVATEQQLTLLGSRVAEPPDPTPPARSLSHLVPVLIYDE